MTQEAAQIFGIRGALRKPFTAPACHWNAIRSDWMDFVPLDRHVGDMCNCARAKCAVPSSRLSGYYIPDCLVQARYRWEGKEHMAARSEYRERRVYVERDQSGSAQCRNHLIAVGDLIRRGWGCTYPSAEETALGSSLEMRETWGRRRGRF